MVKVYKNSKFITALGKGMEITLKYGGREMDGDILCLADAGQKPVSILYNGKTIAEISEGETVVLTCGGKIMRGNITLGKTEEETPSNFILADGTVFITSDGQVFIAKEDNL